MWGVGSKRKSISKVNGVRSVGSGLEVEIIFDGKGQSECGGGADRAEFLCWEGICPSKCGQTTNSTFRARRDSSLPVISGPARPPLGPGPRQLQELPGPAANFPGSGSEIGEIFPAKAGEIKMFQGSKLEEEGGFRKSMRVEKE